MLLTYKPVSSTWNDELCDLMEKWYNPISLQFDSVINLERPCHFINWVGFMVKLYSIILVIHFPLFHSQSSWTKISLTALLGTYAVISDCRTYTLKYFKSFTKAYANMKILSLSFNGVFTKITLEFQTDRPSYSLFNEFLKHTNYSYRSYFLVHSFTIGSYQLTVS